MIPKQIANKRNSQKEKNAMKKERHETLSKSVINKDTNTDTINRCIFRLIVERKLSKTKRKTYEVGKIRSETMTYTVDAHRTMSVINKCDIAV